MDHPAQSLNFARNYFAWSAGQSFQMVTQMVIFLSFLTNYIDDLVRWHAFLQLNSTSREMLYVPYQLLRMTHLYNVSDAR